MTQWDSDLEDIISEVGDYAEAQMRDIIDPKASTFGSVARIFYRAAKTGNIIVRLAFFKAGLEFENGTGFSPLQPLVDIAEQNGSTAGDKIKNVILVEKTLKNGFRKNLTIKNTPTLPDIIRRVDVAKHMGLKI